MVLLGNGASALTHGHVSPRRPRFACQQVTVNVYGHNNVIATDGSVLTTGQHSPVNANTGDVSSSGTLGIDTDRSSLESGATAIGAPRPMDSARFAEIPSRDVARRAFKDTDPVRHVRSANTLLGRRRSTAISGYEDHSVRVTGEDQKAVYDDSNLFVGRNGKINANTGDTDSSGLNTVDVSDSTVRSGDHIEGDENDDGDSDDGKKDAGARRSAPSPRIRRLSNGHPSSSVTDEGESRADGSGALTVGGDGYDNLSVDVRGRRNTAAYDDSNVVVGGTGDVNAQIGDSDTSGAVVMGIAHSRIRSGKST
jgi:hypothetical protein